MKKILIILSLIYNFAFSNSLELSDTDIIILKKIKSLTDDKMMKYTLMALAIKESSIGKNQINLISNDFGLFQSNIKSVIRRQKVADNLFNRRYFAQKLLSDVGFATANAIVEVDFWRRMHKENWVKVWASYNTGWDYKSDIGVNYASSIFDIIKKLKFEYNL